METTLVRIRKEDHDFLTQIRDELSAKWGRQATFADATQWLIKYYQILSSLVSKAKERSNEN